MTVPLDPINCDSITIRKILMQKQAAMAEALDLLMQIPLKGKYAGQIVDAIALLAELPPEEAPRA